MKWKSAAGIEFVKDEEGNITETIPEMVAKFLKFASEAKDLEYHEKEQEHDRRCPTSELS